MCKAVSTTTFLTHFLRELDAIVALSMVSPVDDCPASQTTYIHAAFPTASRNSSLHRIVGQLS